MLHADCHGAVISRTHSHALTEAHTGTHAVLFPTGNRPLLTSHTLSDTLWNEPHREGDLYLNPVVYAHF